MNQLNLIPKILFPQKIYFGNKSLVFLQTIQDKKRSILISKNFNNIKNENLRQYFGNATIIELSGEPTIHDYESIKKMCAQHESDYLIAIGGGSVIDLAKCVKKDLRLILVVIPTTIGSGSEVSQYSVLTDTKTDQKKIIASEDLLPEIIIFDNSFFDSLSREQIIHQSLDALTHGLESLVSRYANNFSDIFARMSIQQIINLLEEFNDEISEKNIMEQLKIASTLAGIAQSSSATGIVHAFAHVIGVKAKINHASAVSRFLPDCLELNMSKTDKYNKLNALNKISEQNIINRLKKIYKKHKISFNKLNISEEKDKLALLIKRDICMLSNPYQPTIEEITMILDKHI